MTSLLIGHTGFVGGALHRAGKFDVAMNSASISEIKGGEFDLVICAGARSRKWWANENPTADADEIAALTSSLKTIKAREFVLISTIDVYPQTIYSRRVDEDEPLNIHDHTQAYGRHRLGLEKWVQETFSNSRIVRLPALFGVGMKKNALFDLLHANNLERLNPRSQFQWYPLRWLMYDIVEMLEKNWRVLNLFPEPLSTEDIRAAFFPSAVLGPRNTPLAEYNITSKYFPFPGYRATRAEILGEMADFIIAERNTPCQP